MKYTVLVMTFLFSLFATVVLAEPDVFGPRDIDFIVGEVEALPVGLTVKHDPDTVMPSFSGPGGSSWTHRTTVAATDGPITVIEYGCLLERDGYWDYPHGIVEKFTGAEFAERFGCPDAVLKPGETYSFEWNRSIKDRPMDQVAKWYFIGEDSDGNRVKGAATVTLQDDSTELCFNFLER